MPDDPDWSALCVFFEKFDRVANGQNRFGGVVGDLAAKFFLKGHNELDRVETVGAEVIDEAGVLGHFVRLDAEMFHDDFFHALANITHRSNLILQRDPSSSLQFYPNTSLNLPTAVGRHRFSGGRSARRSGIPAPPAR